MCVRLAFGLLLLTFAHVVAGDSEILEVVEPLGSDSSATLLDEFSPRAIGLLCENADFLLAAEIDASTCASRAGIASDKCKAIAAPFDFPLKSDRGELMSGEQVVSLGQLFGVCLQAYVLLDDH